MIGDHRVRNAVQVLKDTVKKLDPADRDESLRRIEDIDNCFTCMQQIIKTLIRRTE